MPPDPLTLRRDVRRLGRLLGSLLREMGPESLYPRVEAVRRASLARRRDGATDVAELATPLAGLAPNEALDLVRAFSTWFELVNLAERVHRLRRRREYRREGEAQPGGLADVLGRLKARGADASTLQSILSGLVLEPVFTAHPTEAVRRTLLVKELRMLRALDRRTEHEADTSERTRDQSRALRRVRSELTAAWLTEEHRAARPSVADEREEALFFLSESIWRAVPALRRALSTALGECYGPEARPLARLPQLRFASWIGGDMDGNPAVGSATIRATLTRHAELCLEGYERDVRDLFKRLSLSRSRVGRFEPMEARLEEYRARLPDAAGEIPGRYGDMPYREFLWMVATRLGATRTRGDLAYADPEEFIDDLRLVGDGLHAHRATRAGLGGVKRLIERVQCFGFHLATLDVRQDALVHRAIAGEVLGVAGFGDLGTDERARLLREYQGVRGPEALGEDARAGLDVFAAIGEVRRRHGEEAIGLYIISMARGPDDVLAVLALARAGGLADGEGRVPLDVAPLFETVDDLEQAPRTLEALLEDPLWRAHLARRGDRQWIMLGYSDSNKTSGLVAARVALEQAQHDLLAVAAKAGVTLRFFHGRGGSTSRGGSKPRAAVLAAPHGSLGGHLRVTEQGEIIRSKFGERGIAERTLEIQWGALLERSALDLEAPSVNEEGESHLRELAQHAREAYRALVEGDPDFLPYFQSATPIDVIERLGLGSRPSRRRAMRGIEDLRAIPWVFAWTQCRLLLPGWYGAGTALAKFIVSRGPGPLRLLAGNSPFFQTLLSDLEMVLAKSDLGIAAHYAPLAGPKGPALFARLAEEHERTRAHLLEVLEAGDLLEGDPVLRRAIELRNPYIDPMSLVQVDLLARWRATGREDPELERALFGTIHGIARGMQNTG